MRHLTFIAAALLLTVLAGCGSDSCPTDTCFCYCDSRYPAKVGHRWVYSRVDSMFNYRSASGSLLDDSWRTVVTVNIVRTEELDCCGFAHVFAESWADPYGGIHAGEAYYTDEPQGLYLVAYRNHSRVTPFASNAIAVELGGRSFGSIHEIAASIVYGVEWTGAQYDSLRFEKEPPLVLKYPLAVGSEWVYRPRNTPWLVAREILGVEQVTVPAGEFTCYKVAWLVDIDDDGEWDADVEFVDYISTQGLVRRSLFLKDVTMRDTTGNTVGYFDALERSDLTDFRLE